MRISEREYLALKRRNRTRLKVAVITSVVIVSLAYLILKAENTAQMAKAESQEVAITIADDKASDERKESDSSDKNGNNGKVASAFSQTDIEKRSEIDKLVILDHAIEEAKKSVVVSDTATSVDDKLGHNTINDLAPMVVGDQLSLDKANTGRCQCENENPSKIVTNNKPNSMSSLPFKKESVMVNNVNASTENKRDIKPSRGKTMQANKQILVGTAKKVKAVQQVNMNTIAVNQFATQTKEKSVYHKQTANIQGMKPSETKLNTVTSKKLAYQSLSADKLGGRKQIITVQVASLSDPVKAQALKSVLAGKGYPARVERFKTKNRDFYYRVRVGAYSDKNQAVRVVTKLKLLGYSATISI